MKVGFDAAYMNFVNANKQSIKKKLKKNEIFTFGARTT